MATIDAIFTPAGAGATTTADINATLATVTSTADIVLGTKRLFAVNATGDLNIRFGSSGAIANASAADFRIPAGTTAVYDTGIFDRIRLFNAGGGTITYWIQPLQRT